MVADTGSEVPSTGSLRRTPLHDLHISRQAKMVPFAGYDMPVSYPLGTLKEHLNARESVGIFDVSHMGQFLISSEEAVAQLMERLVPGNIVGLKPGRMRYTQLTNSDGGIIDDLMVTRLGVDGGRDWLFLVVNGARKEVDLAHIKASIGDAANVVELEDQALIAVQGPMAASHLERLFKGVSAAPFMSIMKYEDSAYGKVWISRCGYTGEDGFEISLAGLHAATLAEKLLSADGVELCGLGARDSLRLEAGLCLYGHDIDEATSPVEAGLTWSIGKRRRENGGFPGDKRIMRELEEGADRRLVGISPLGRAPAREGVAIVDGDGKNIGQITSGGFSPTLSRPIAMGYVAKGFAAAGTELGLLVRGKTLAAEVVDLPFVPHRYYRSRKA